MLIYLNGKWVDEDHALVPFNDQGFLYGDSLFETIRVNHGRPFRPMKHLERMAQGMDIIRMDAEKILQGIPELIEEFIQKNHLDDALLRLMITRGTLKGTPWSGRATPNIYITARPLSPLPEIPAKVVFLEESHYPILRFNPAIKSGNYLGNLLAKKDAEAMGAFEPVFVNKDGLITECAIRNIFFIKDGILLTPSTELGVLPGVIRDTIINLAYKRNIEVKETAILRLEADDMDEAFISSSGVGVLPVTWEGFSSDYVISYHLRTDLETLWKNGDTHAS